MKRERPYIDIYLEIGFIARFHNRRIVAYSKGTSWKLKFVNCYKEQPNLESFDSVIKRCGRYVTEKYLQISDEAFSVIAEGYIQYIKQLQKHKTTTHS